MLKDIDMGKINIDDIDSQVFQTIYIQKSADPDLLIRPSGELRLSNFYYIK